MGLSKLIFLCVFLSSVVICAIIFIVVRIINKRRSFPQKQSEDQPYTPNNTIPRESVQNISEKDIQKEANRALWEKTFKLELEQSNINSMLENTREKTAILLSEHKYSEAMCLVENTLSKLSPEDHATNRHFFLVNVIDDFYKLRDIDQNVLYHCLTLCDLDLGNVDNLIKQMSLKWDYPTKENGKWNLKEPPIPKYEYTPFYMITPTRKAIILEKLGDIDGAIAVCDISLQLNITDSNGESFLKRKTRLEKKKANTAKTKY